MAKKKAAKKAGRATENAARLFISRKSRAQPYIPRFAGKFVSKKDLLNLKEIKGQFPYMKDAEILSEYKNGEFSQAEQPPYFTPIWDIKKVVEGYKKIIIISEGVKETLSRKKGEAYAYRILRYYYRKGKAAGAGSDEIAQLAAQVTENEGNNTITLDLTSVDTFLNNL